MLLKLKKILPVVIGLAAVSVESYAKGGFYVGPQVGYAHMGGLGTYQQDENIGLVGETKIKSKGTHHVGLLLGYDFPGDTLCNLEFFVGGSFSGSSQEFEAELAGGGDLRRVKVRENVRAGARVMIGMPVNAAEVRVGLGVVYGRFNVSGSLGPVGALTLAGEASTLKEVKNLLGIEPIVRVSLPLSDDGSVKAHLSATYALYAKKKAFAMVQNIPTNVVSHKKFGPRIFGVSVGVTKSF